VQQFKFPKSSRDHAYLFKPLLRIRDIFVRIRFRGVMDLAPGPAIFVIDLEDANKKLYFSTFSAYYFLRVHLHHFLKIKEGSGSGSVYQTNGS
jgi:hypothetical protein